MPLLTHCVNELTIIVALLKQIDQDNINSHSTLLAYNSRIMEASKHLPDLIDYAGTHHPDPTIVGTKMKDAIQLFSNMLKEKTRILNNTPEIFKDMNEMNQPN